MISLTENAAKEIRKVVEENKLSENHYSKEDAKIYNVEKRENNLMYIRSLKSMLL